MGTPDAGLLTGWPDEVVPVDCWSEGRELPDWIEMPTTSRGRASNAVLQMELQELAEIVGRYSRGELPVYEGSLTARDNSPDLWPTAPTDAVMNDGLVVASASSDGRGTFVLQAFSESQSRKIAFTQVSDLPETTEVEGVNPYGVRGGLEALCDGCVTPFIDRPETISVDVRDARGDMWIEDRTGEPARFTVSASGELVQVAVASVTWAQIATLSEEDSAARRTIAAFVAAGDEMVRSVDEGVRLPAPDVRDAVGAPYQECMRDIAYTALWWVDATCPSSYGVRSFEVVSVDTICCYCPGGGECSERTCDSLAGFD